MTMKRTGTLTFFCGKMGAGKSSMAVGEAKEKNAVLLSEDAWLAQLYPNQISTFDDYLKLSRQMRPVVRKLVQDMLRAGTSVVMDYPANTVSQRRWFRELAEDVDASHEMIYLDASNEICLLHIARRREEQPERAAFDREDVFHQVSRTFEAPSDKEALNVRTINVR